MLPVENSAFQPLNLIPGDKHEPHAHKAARILKFFYVVSTLAFGVSLLVLPWSSLWENNYLIHLYPQIRLVVANPYFKGAVVGLGIANIVIGFDEIDYFRGIAKGRFFR